MCGAIVSPQNVSGVEGLLTVSTGIFLHQLLKRRRRNSVRNASPSLEREATSENRFGRTATLRRQQSVTSDLCVGRLHVRNIRVSFGEPLEAHATRPAGGLGARSAVRLRPFFGTVHLFHGVGALLLGGMDPVAPLLAVFPHISVLGLRRHVSYMNALRNKDIKGKKEGFKA